MDGAFLATGGKDGILRIFKTLKNKDISKF